MTKKYLIVVAPLVAIVAASIFAWNFYETKAKAAKLEAEILKELSPDDLRAIFASQPATASLLEDAIARQAFLKGLKEYLALAAQARREGLAEDGLFKINFDYKKTLLLADAYDRQQTTVTGKSVPVTEEEMSAVWRDPSSEARFRETMDALAAIQRDVQKQRGSDLPISGLQGEALERARRNWARAHHLAAKANAETGFVDSKEIQLRVKILEAGILSADYLRKHFAADLQATEDEIRAYLDAHPEYREERKKELAEQILARLKAGEDFAAVARAESEDRSSRDNGGLLEDVPVDQIWGEVENVALSLEPGQINPELVATDVGFHIVKLEKKSGGPDGKPVKYSFRQILIQRAFEDPNYRVPGVPAPFTDARTIAATAIEQEKRNRFVERVIAEAGVSVPEDI